MYSKNAELEDVVANLKQLNRMNEEGGRPDEEHLKEIMGAQTLLREEMKEKEFFKEQAQNLTQKLVSIEETYLEKSKAIETNMKNNKEEMIQLELKNQEKHLQKEAALRQVEEKDEIIKNL